MPAADVFEAIMLVCFGISWPVHNLRTWRVKRTEGQSLAFMVLILVGYVSGMLFNFSRKDGPTMIFFLYLFNLLMVSLAVWLNLRYRAGRHPEVAQDNSDS